MDSISRIYFDVIGRDQGAQKVLGDAAGKAGLAHDAMSRLSGTLSMLGGPFGQVQMLAGSLTDSFDVLQEHGKNLRTVLTASGLGVAGLGVALAGFASKDQQAQAQLRQSITNTGRSYSDYGKRIEEAIRTEEGFGHTANDTQDALNALTTATQSPSKALAEMGDVANLAAERNMTLAEAAGQLVRAQQGSTRSLLALGIHLDGVGSKTDQVNRALLELHNRLAGQAGAAVDSFGGRVKVLSARVEDQIAKWGKYAPALTIAGSAMTLYAATLQRTAATQVSETVTLAANTRAQQANAAARGENAAAATAEAAAIGRAAGLEGAGSVIGAGMVGGIPTTRGLARGIGGRLLRGGGYYLGGQVAGQLIGGQTGGIVSDVGMGAGIGAIAGPEGAAVGAGVGAVVGGLSASGYHGVSQQGMNAYASTARGAASLRSELAKLEAEGKKSSNVEMLLNMGLRKQYDEALKAGHATDEHAKSLIKEAHAASIAKTSLKDQTDALAASQKTALDLSSAEDALQGGMHTLAQAVHDGSRALQGHTAAAAANRDALRNIVGQETAVVQAMQADHQGRLKVQAAALAMSQAVERNATALLGNKAAADKFLQSIGAMPLQVAQALGATEMYSENIGEQIDNALAAGIERNASAAVQAAEALNANVGAAIAGKGLRTMNTMPGDLGGQAIGGSYASHHSGAVHAAQQAGQDVANSYVNSYTPVVDAGVAGATAGASNAASKGLTKAQQQAKAALAAVRQAANQELQTAKQFEQQQAQSYRSYASLSAQPTSGVGVQTFLNAKRNDLLRFVRDRNKLRGMGASDALIAQFDEVGPAGSAAMEALMAQGRRAVHRADQTEAQIGRISNRLAREQTREDFTKPLKAAIESLPPKFQHAFEEAIRKHLHIEVNVKDGGHAVHTGRRSHHGASK